LPRGARRLLLIEDDSALSAHLTELLVLEGYDVVCAGDGVEALSRLSRESLPTVIVLDIGLPRMDGFSFRTVQLQSAPIRDIPTIAFTSHTNAAKLADFRFDAVVRKTGSLDELMEALATVCGRHEPPV
jgi:CheY-like chemotaxis protein